MTKSSGSVLRRPNDPTLLILTSLAAGPKHGHALAKDIDGSPGCTSVPAPCTAPSPASRSAASSSRSHRTTAAAPTGSPPPASAALAAAVTDLRRIADVGAGRLGLTLGVTG